MFFACAVSHDLSGLARFDDVFHTFRVPSKHASAMSAWGQELPLSDRGNDCSPPTIIFPSWLHAQDVTLVRAPRSFDLTTITCFCLNRSLTSHILSHQQAGYKQAFRATYLRVESFEQVRNFSLSVGCHEPRLISAVWPLCSSQYEPGRVTMIRFRPHFVFFISRR